MNTQIEEIIYAHLSGENLSVKEKEIFDKWFADSKNKEEYKRLLLLRSRFRTESKINSMDDRESWNNLDKRLFHSVIPHFPYRKIMAYTAAIILPLFVIAGFYYMVDLKTTEELAVQFYPIKPGKSQAILTLASGEIVSLNERKAAVIIDNKGEILAQESENMLVYSHGRKIEKEEYNKVSVPRGGEFQITLSDGTKVWLNSETELKYPVHFIGKERKIFLNGEAFFEVAHDKKKPFIVVSERQNVQVYGTSFNVKDYLDEEFVQTTLAEGSVKVYDRESKLSTFIKPGEQAVLGNNRLNVRKVDVGQYVSWKEGEFVFKQERLENIMKKISRWYDVEIFYLNQSVKDYHFTAWFKKDRGIDYVIKQLRATNRLDVRIKNRTIIISDKIR